MCLKYIGAPNEQSNVASQIQGSMLRHGGHITLLHTLYVLTFDLRHSTLQQQKSDVQNKTTSNQLQRLHYGLVY